MHEAGICQVTASVLNSYIFEWLIDANNRIHGTTGKKPSDLLIEESQCLIKYKDIVTPIITTTISYRRVLPFTTVDKPNLKQYDLLLGEAI